LVSSDSADGVIHTHGIPSKIEDEQIAFLLDIPSPKSEMVGGTGDAGSAIERLVNLQLPAHTMPNSSAANGVFD